MLLINIKRLLPKPFKFLKIRLFCVQKVNPVLERNNEDYEFIQKSKLPTMIFQPSLPRLPIPQLEKSCFRFLSAAHPILSAEDYRHTEIAVKEFQTGIGMDLHAQLKLQDSANKNTSYISEPWFDAYLSDRSPLPLNVNPLLIMKNDPRSEYQSQIVRAANLVISSLRFWRSLKENFLEPEVFHLNAKKSDTEFLRQCVRYAPSPLATYVAYAFKAFPLDMSQYDHLFGVSRIPMLHKDRLIQNADSKHIIVLRRGNMYAVDVLKKNGKMEKPATILARLRDVVAKDEYAGPAEAPIGVLTALSRDVWALSRKHLTEKICEQNKNILENEVDCALFCLCLDDSSDPIYDHQNPVPLIKHFLAGRAENRWFDKSVSLLVGSDGTAAVNFEHSWGDGVAVLRYFNEIYKETRTDPFLSINTESFDADSSSCVRPLHFKLDEKLKLDILAARKQHYEVMMSLEIHLLRYEKLNKAICKLKKVSPDAIMQLAFQLAYRRAFNEYVGSYESCSTAAFRHGRTETIRPCTMATKMFCDAILQCSKKSTSQSQLRTMIDNCSKTHGTLTKEAAMGQGFDRHLFALKYIALRNNTPVPELYSTYAYKKLNYNIISTSTLSSNALLAGSFGPVVRDGLGIGYQIHNDECGAIVTSYEKGRSGKCFVDNLKIAFEDIHEILKN